MKQVLSAINYCHTRNVVHRYSILTNRDLKLNNLVLEEDDIESNLKVIDFGTCIILKNKTFMHGIAGTVKPP